MPPIPGKTGVVGKLIFVVVVAFCICVYYVQSCRVWSDAIYHGGNAPPAFTPDGGSSLNGK